ncbi:MAG: sigma-70 family RNA polymerase sigma factor [Candidatus Krumholzibacteriota bacterium]|nr:sigma-70 family RNA polymerase sigma factor [Candidatus Krumholzibacteriota bacterium]
MNGDAEAFGAIVDLYMATIYKVAFRMTGDRDDAMEISQTVFVKVYERLGTYDPAYRFFSWIYRIAVNESLNFIKRRRRLAPLDGFDLQAPSNPEGEYSRAESGELIQEALLRVKPDFRIVLILKHFHDLSYREIAAFLSIPEKTVKSRLYTGRQLLKDILVKRGYER